MAVTGGYELYEVRGIGILGIDNRTENWNTVEHFHRISEDAKVGLVRRLLGSEDLEVGEIDIELFWYGLRDWAHARGGPSALTDAWLEQCYNRKFQNLRRDLKGFIGAAGQSPTLNQMEDWNYVVSMGTGLNSLRNNLINTEVDIVLDTNNHLFIGEAKLESTFGADSRYLLVHQLIRQYVMATMLLDKLELKENKKVVPFIVGKDAEQIKGHHQVKFIMERKWLKPENVLRGCLKRWDPGQAAQHQSGHRDVNPCSRGFTQPLIVLAQTPLQVQPAEGAFHYPAPRQYLENMLLRGPAHQLQTPATRFLGPLHQLAAVGSVGPNQL